MGKDQACTPAREKNWDELNEHESIERMRNVVKVLKHRIKGLEQQVCGLMEHFHNDKGEIAVKLKNNDGSWSIRFDPHRLDPRLTESSDDFF